MKKIMVTGALGQIGSELTSRLREIYGNDNVVATDIRKIAGNKVVEAGPFEILDVMDASRMAEIAKDHKDRKSVV